MSTNYFSKYKNYPQNSIDKEEVIKNTKMVVNDNFDDSFFTESVLVEDVVYDVILKHTKDSEKKKLIFKPDIKISIGDVAKVDESHFLIMDFLSDGIYESYPVAKIQLCNSTFPLKGSVTKTQTDTNDFGEPIYSYAETDPIILYCIVESTFTALGVEQPINLPEGRIKVKIPYTTHEDIAIGKEFTMYDEQYEITGIVYTDSINEVGILTINGERKV